MDERTYGLAAKEEFAGRTGREALQGIIDGKLPQAPISKILSFWLTEVGDGFAAFEGEPRPDLCNPMGSVHGGWALTLIDSVAGCAAHSVLPAGAGYTTLETKAYFSRPIGATSGRVRAEGRVVGQGRQVISAEARVTAGDGKILAHGVSTLLVLGGGR